METITEKHFTNLLELNSYVLDREIEWFRVFLDQQTLCYFHRNKDYEPKEFIPPPSYDGDMRNAPYLQILHQHKMDLPERVILLLALLPHIKPELLDLLFVKNDRYDRLFTEFGGILGHHHRGFIPTGETAMFILAANNLQLRFRLSQLFSRDHFFSKYNILSLADHKNGEPDLSGTILLSKEYLSFLTTGESHKPEYSSDFPASIISTKLDWEDLVLSSDTLESIEEISIWLKHGKLLLDDKVIGKQIKRGYRSLFYGPSGTGKTMTASLLGKTAGLDVYRVDLSMIVSKYIGETEKNLSKIFDQAENRDWILFFDEADALFGKRTQTNSSNDRHANQEVSYLLQRIEDFPGVVILASNYKSNMDTAFMRRFQSIIRFAMPSEGLRTMLYEKSFKGQYSLAEDIDLQDIARKYELSGGNIINVLRYCAMMSIHKNEQVISEENFHEGIRKELKKVGKTM